MNAFFKTIVALLGICAGVAFAVILLGMILISGARSKIASAASTNASIVVPTDAEIVSSIIAPTAPATAVEPLIGAFGVRLGQTFSPDEAIGSGELTDKTPMYEFAPASPFRSFKRYYVLITPKTHKVYSIWAIGSVESVAEGKKEQAVVMKLLQDKYGPSERQGMIDALGDVVRIDKGDRYVLTKLTGFVDVSIDLRYYDRSLEKLAEPERLEIESRKVDASGL